MGGDVLVDISAVAVVVLVNGDAVVVAALDARPDEDKGMLLNVLQFSAFIIVQKFRQRWLVELMQDIG
jgi:hypothetical protein